MFLKLSIGTLEQMHNVTILSYLPDPFYLFIVCMVIIFPFVAVLRP